LEALRGSIERGRSQGGKGEREREILLSGIPGGNRALLEKAIQLGRGKKTRLLSEKVTVPMPKKGFQQRKKEKACASRGL